MAGLLDTLEGPIPRPLLWIGVPVAAFVLIATFVFLGFPYDRLADSLTQRASAATGTDVTIGDLDARITIGGPGFRARDITVTTRAKQTHRIDSLALRPAWSLSWLSGSPAIHVDAESAMGHASGIVEAGREPAWDVELEDVDFARLPIPMPSDIVLRGLVSGNVDLTMAEAGPDGSVDLVARNGSLAHPLLPVEVEYESLHAQLLLGGEHYAEIQRIQIDGPSLAAKISGTVGHGVDAMAQPLSVRIDLQIKDRAMQSMLRQFGVELQPDGRTQFELGGTAGNPMVL